MNYVSIKAMRSILFISIGFLLSASIVFAQTDEHTDTTGMDSAVSSEKVVGNDCDDEAGCPTEDNTKDDDCDDQVDDCATPVSISVCTADAKMCPDGSAVGRTGPDCTFAACPGEVPEGGVYLELGDIKGEVDDVHRIGSDVDDDPFGDRLDADDDGDSVDVSEAEPVEVVDTPSTNIFKKIWNFFVSWF